MALSSPLQDCRPGNAWLAMADQSVFRCRPPGFTASPSWSPGWRSA